MSDTDIHAMLDDCKRMIDELPSRAEFAALKAKLAERTYLLQRVMDQADNDLKSAHGEIIKLQGKDPADFDWPAWTPQANSIRWHAKIRAELAAEAREG